MIEYAVSFVAVVQAGSFSEATKKTCISKACLSRHVSQLEKILGIRLLHRTTRSVVLTESGKRFFESCQAIQENYQQAVNSIKKDDKKMEGTLKVTAPIDFGIQFLPGVIEAYTKEYPNMNVVLNLSNINEMITESHYDLAVRVANQLPDSNLRMSTLSTFKRLLCASPAYLRKYKKPKTIDDLKNHRCITSVNRNMGVIKAQWQFFENKKVINFSLNKSIEVDSLFAQMDLIKRGCGIGRLPNYVINAELQSGELIEILPNIEKPDSHIYLLFPDTIAIPQKTRSFMDLLKKTMQL